MTKTPEQLQALATEVEMAFVAAPRDNLPLISVNGREIPELAVVLGGPQQGDMRFAICKALRKHAMPVGATMPNFEVHIWTDNGRECIDSYTILEASS